MQERFTVFTLLMAQITRSIRKIKTEEMAEFNLKSQHVSCLYYLYRGGALTAKALCDVSDEDKANISRSIEYLEENGYLVSRAQPSRRYKRLLTLTEKGEDVARRLAARVDDVLCRASAGVSDEDRAVMYRCLDTINANLTEICNQYDD